MSEGVMVLGARTVLGVADLERARGFWSGELGFEVVATRSDTLVLRAGDAEIALESEVRPTAARVVLHVRGIEALRDRLLAHGSRLVTGLHTHESGRRDFEVTDPDGHHVRFVEDERTGARVVGLSLAVEAPEASLAFWRAVAGFDAEGPGLRADGRPVASVAFAHGVVPSWLTHFAVDDLEEALGEVERRGGQVAFRSEGFAVVRDPNGALAALVQG
jgi:predicted enzyme related to lactoylglutathione lyase